VNARAAAAWSAAAVVIVVAGNNPVYRILVALAALNLLVVWRRPGRSFRGLVVLVLSAGVFSIALNLLLSHGGAHVVAHLPRWLPGIGGPLSLESAAFGFGAATGVGAAALAVAPLSAVLEPHQLIDALPGPLQRTGAALAGSLNLVPGIARSFVGVHEAQRLRGVTGPRAGTRGVLVPVLLTAMESSVELAEAMEARGYGSGPRTRFRPERWSRSDIATIALAVVGATAFLAGRATGLAQDWYPFPTIIAPSVSMAMVGACALLLAPSLMPRGQAEI
jgi:energy-coupling factor transport system permease protein